MPRTILLSAAGAAVPDDLREWLGRAGFSVRPHGLGSPPSLDLDALQLAVIEVGAMREAAAAQTRRWRAEQGDALVPIVWVIASADAELAASGLDAGADAVLARPIEGAVLVAQVGTSVRARMIAGRLATRAAEARLLAEQATRARSQLDRELDAARRVRLAFLPRSIPALGPVRFAVSHRSRACAGGDFFGAYQLDEHRVAFYLGDVLAPGSACGILGPFIAEHLARSGSDVPSAAGLLVGVNRALLQLGIDELPLVALVVGVLDRRSGALSVARAGLPALVRVPVEGEPEVWAIPGPFLGIAETTYPERSATLRPGEKLLLGTDGAVPAEAPAAATLAPVAARHRGLSGQAFVDAVARDLLPTIQHEDDFTLLCVELTVLAE